MMQDAQGKAHIDVRQVEPRPHWISWYFCRGVLTIAAAPLFFVLAYCVAVSTFGAIIQLLALMRAARAAFGFVGLAAAVMIGWIPAILPPILYYSVLKNLPGLWRRADASRRTKVVTSIIVCVLFPLISYLIYHANVSGIAWLADRNPSAALAAGVTGSRLPPEAEAAGELFPYFMGNEFRFVGSYSSDDVYIRPNETGRLAHGVFVADTFIVTEVAAIMVCKRSADTIAVVADENAIHALRDSDFAMPQDDTLLKKALDVYTTQKSSNGQIRQGRSSQWLYVDLSPDLHIVFVATADGAELRNGIEIIPLLSVKEQRCSVHIDSRNRLFAPVNTDLFMTPQQEIEYRPMREGAMEDRIWEIIQEMEKL